MTQHIYLGKSRERSWCGLYVGFHAPKPAIIESDYTQRREMNVVASICRNCRRSFDAHEKAAA